ncbi:uncharacterized protein LOC122919906 [Bufo gargarizans]|uniref:uncharacterized protein LOC122919906 n=1 Tax=Bufo gargarizans TaxID=30331 RepID=UPI001CF2EE73|nr:uncharacterized protein LOC122919906 [Bufo gargarizans]
MSMWLIVCILTSRCKNKVTNVADPECPVQQRPEDCPEPHHGLKGHLADHILEDRLVRSLPPCYVKASEIRSTVRTVPPHNGSPNDKGKDSDRLLPSDLRSSNSEPLVYSVDASAPVLNAFGIGGIVACQAPVRVHPAPDLYRQDHINPSSTSSTLHMEAARFYLLGKSNSENETSVHGNPGDSLTGETGLVTYFEAHINSMKNSKNVSKTEGSDPSSEQVSSLNGNPFSFGKKCKTWSAFCVLQDKVIMKPSEIPDISEKDIDAFVGKGDLSEEGDCEREAESSRTSQEDKEREELSKPNHVDRRPGDDEGSPHKDATSGRNLLVSKDDMSESRAEEGPCRRQHQGPSRKNPTTKPKESRSSEHERFWKYHKNCCNELEPCQTASKVLRQLKMGPWETKEVEQELPPDEELLEGRQSLPLLLSKPCKGQIPTNPAISSKKTSVSLPDLNVYENNNPSLISANLQYTEPVQDETGKENATEGVTVYNTDLPVIDLSAGAMVSSERLAEASPCKTNLPNEDVLTKDFISGGEGLDDVSGDLGPNCSDVASENSAGEWYSKGQDPSPCKPDLQVLTIQAQDLVSYDGNSEALPDISAPCGGMLREDNMSQVVSSSNLELPAINLQTEGPLTTEIGDSLSSSNLHLPIIDASAGGNTVGQDDMLVSKVQEQSVVRDKKFIDVLSGLSDVPILHKDRIPNKVDLPTADVQSEGLVISESNRDDVVHCNLSLQAISEEAKTSGECKTIKQRGSQTVKAKSCPILSVMLDNRDRNPSYNRRRLKSKPDLQAISVARDPRSNMTTQPDATTFETSQDFPCKPVETMNTSSYESPLFTEEQDLSSGGFSDINLPTETQLTPSGSYSISIQDGDEISAWPNTVDFLKRSSTISLSSKYDILEASTVPQCKDDSDHCTVLDNGHNAVNSDISTCGADSLGNKSVLQQYDHKDESDKKASCPEELGSIAGGKDMGQNTLHTCSTLEDLLERHSENQTTDAQQPPQHYNMERVVMNEQTNLKQTSNVEEIVTGKDAEECRKESSDTMIAHDGSEDVACHQFSLVLNGQREVPNEQEEPLKDVSSSSLATMVQISQHEAPRSKDKMMKSQKNNSVTGNDHGIHNIRQDDTQTECCTSNLDMSYVDHEEDSHIETDQLDDLVGNYCKSADLLTCRQQKLKNNQETREVDTMKETHNSDSEDQPSLRPNLSRSKDVTTKIRKNIGARKLDANETFKTAPCIQDIGQDLKDYISTRLSRRPFQSVFPVSEKTRCLEDDSNLNAFPLEEQQFNNVTEITDPANMVSSSIRQTNGDTEKSSKMTDAIKYLTYLYARSPRPEITCGVPIDDTNIDDIRVLANLQFCKVSGGFIDDAKVPETVREAAEGPKLTLSKPDNLYIPPSKEELQADEELAVLHVMYTLKKSLELSASCEPDNRTDM